MGEYAIRSDGEEIKVGTCEEMLYLRFSDRHKVTAKQGSLDVNDDSVAGELLFRLPFPDEDGLLPGDYDNPFRRVRLYDKDGNDYIIPELVAQPGIMQMTHGSGLLLNVPCYHGLKLPEVGDADAFWNGKSWSLELAMLGATLTDGKLVLHPVIACRWCRKMWRTTWEHIWDYIPGDSLKANLLLETGRDARLANGQFLNLKGAQR